MRFSGLILVSGVLSSCFFELSDVVESAPDGSTSGTFGTVGRAGTGGRVGSGGNFGGGNAGSGGSVGDASAGIGGAPDVATGGSGDMPSGGVAGAGDASDADAGAGATRCASVCGTPGCGACPTSPTVSVGSYDIDAYEVTNAEYAAWLALDPVTSDQLRECEDNSSFDPEPPCANPPPSRLQEPVACVDWCDAFAYCTWAKRMLCHDITGSPLYFFDYDDPAHSQWYAACSRAGARQYPYGAQYEPLRCNGRDYNRGSPIDVHSASGCQGGHDGIFHMSGNVGEWEYACTGQDANAQCRVRGGSYADFSGSIDCDAPFSDTRYRNDPKIGFRCCSAP